MDRILVVVVERQTKTPEPEPEHIVKERQHQARLRDWIEQRKDHGYHTE